MKVLKRIYYALGFIAGAVIAFWRVPAGSAGMPPVNINNQGLQPKSRAAQPEPFVQKSHQITVEDASGIKSKGVIGIRPDGRVHGLINRDVLTAESSRMVIALGQEKEKFTIPGKERMLILQYPGGSKSFKGKIIDNRLYFINGDKKILAKDGTYFTKTGEKMVVKGGIIIQKGPAVKGKDKFWYQQPGKSKELKLNPSPENQPGKDKALKLNPSPQSMNRIQETDEPIRFILTEEDSEHLVFENRDHVWLRNSEGFLECQLSDGRRMVIRDNGFCEVYDAIGQMEKSFYHPRAERMAHAAAITRGMKRQISMIKKRGEA